MKDVGRVGSQGRYRMKGKTQGMKLKKGAAGTKDKKKTARKTSVGEVLKRKEETKDSLASTGRENDQKDEMRGDAGSLPIEARPDKRLQEFWDESRLFVEKSVPHFPTAQKERMILNRAKALQIRKETHFQRDHKNRQQYIELPDSEVSRPRENTVGIESLKPPNDTHRQQDIYEVKEPTEETVTLGSKESSMGDMKETEHLEYNWETLPDGAMCMHCGSQEPANMRCNTCHRAFHEGCLAEGKCCQCCREHAPPLSRIFWSVESQRDFPEQVISGKEESVLIPMPLGNLGNTCFIASSLQVILRMEGVIRKCVTSTEPHPTLKELHRAMKEGASQSEAQASFQRLVEWCRQEGVQEKDSDDKWAEGDPQVFTMRLLGEAASLTTQKHQIESEIEIEWTKELRCKTCQHVAPARNRRELTIQYTELDEPLPQWILSQAETGTTMQHCEKCNVHTNHLVKERVCRAPEYLIVAVKQHDSPTPITIPVEITLTECERESAPSRHCVYEVQGYVQHLTTSKGKSHFVSIVRQGKRFKLIDDHRTEDISFEKHCVANMLLYRRLAPEDEMVRGLVSNLENTDV